jgi:hypothetical protein
LVGWFVGWLVDWLVGWLVGWYVLSCVLVGWLVGWLVCFVVCFSFVVFCSVFTLHAHVCVCVRTLHLNISANFVIGQQAFNLHANKQGLK